MTINLNKTRPRLTVGDRMVATQGSALHHEILSLSWEDVTKLPSVIYRGAVLRLDEVHPCGAFELVVLETDQFDETRSWSHL